MDTYHCALFIILWEGRVHDSANSINSIKFLCLHMFSVPSPPFQDVAWGIRLSKLSAVSHCPPFSQALIVALKETSSFRLCGSVCQCRENNYNCHALGVQINDLLDIFGRISKESDEWAMSNNWLPTHQAVLWNTSRLAALAVHK